MLKNPIVRLAIWAVLIALGIWIYVESQRSPDYVAAALKEVPPGCAVTGVWRDTDYPAGLVEQWRNVTILCEAEGTTRLITVFDSGHVKPHIATLDENNSVDNRDFYAVNTDGTLTVSDDFGPVKTLPAVDY